MKYIYSAVIRPLIGADGFEARVPDLPGCVTIGDTISDAIDMITDAASLWLVAAEDNGLTISSPTPQQEIVKEPEDVCSLVKIDTVSYRMATDTRAVRKNVSLPAWMANLADKRGLNCSQLLQDALRVKFDNA